MGAITANIEYGPYHHFEIRAAKNFSEGLYRIQEIQLEKYDVEKLSLFPKETGAPRENVSVTQTDPSGILDVAVLYTPEALAASNGEALAVESQILLAVEMANIAFGNSDINMRAKVVHISPLLDTSYIEGSYSTMLNSLTSEEGDDSFSDDLAIAEAAGADFVALFVNNDEKCGQSWFQFEFPYITRYSVAVINIACPQSFVQELGHNMGATVEEDNSLLTCDDCTNYGYCWDIGPSSCKRSIEATAGKE